MKNIFSALELIEIDLSIAYMVLESGGENIALIRATKNDLLSFSVELVEKIKDAVVEHFAIGEPDNVEINCSHFGSDNVATLLCFLGDDEASLDMSLSMIALY